MTIGQNIRAYRKRRGLTQTRLGELCGVSAAAISSYEKGATTPKRRVMKRLSAALEVSVDRLTGASEVVLPAYTGEAMYNGVLVALQELYGSVEGRVVMGENGASRKYYVIQDVPDSFVLYEQDIAAIARSAQASMSPLVERLRAYA